jgi:hypothetical protein
MPGIWPPQEQPQPSDGVIYRAILLGFALGIITAAIAVNVWRAVA